ncbi:MAG: HYR domain-containing protein, partial [Bacilli bacterium]
MKKGFTLIEIISVIVLIGVIGLIATPIITNTLKDNKESLYQNQLKEIETSASKWAYKNMALLPKVDNQNITITLLDLKKSGLVGLDARNPKTGLLFPNDMQISITYKSNNFSYKVIENSGSNITDSIDKNSPTIILVGNPLEYIEIGSSYQEKGVLAQDSLGNVINNINVQYKLNDVEIPSIITNQFKTYTATYTASSIVNNVTYASNIIRTLIVRDTTPPVITVPDKMEITLDEASTINLLAGVSVTDNSGEQINPTVSGFDRLIGEKIVTYTATDSSGNKTVKKRIIKITENLIVFDFQNFDYTGASQIFSVPINGNYKLETWGASGNFDQAQSGNFEGAGGGG